MSDPLLRETREALLVVLSGLQGPAASREAQAWLDRFQESDVAWEVALKLIAPYEPIQVQFAASNLLRRKAKMQWGMLGPEAKRDLREAFAEAFRTSLRCSIPRMVIVQLCLLRAGTIEEDEEGVGLGELIQESFELLHSLPLAGLDLLVSAGEELGERSRQEQKNIYSSCIDQVILGLKVFMSAKLPLHEMDRAHGDTVNGQQSGLPALMELVRTGLRAIGEWLEVRKSISKSDPIGLLDCSRKFPGLLQFLMSAAAFPLDSDEKISENSFQAISCVLDNSTYETDDADGRYKEEISSLIAYVASILLSLNSRMLSTPMAVAKAVIGIACAIIEYWPEGLSGVLPFSEDLAEFMLESIKRPEPEITEVALDYFLTLNTVPVSQRIDKLRRPLFYSLLSRLLHKASYPESFTSWETYENAFIDSNNFERLRNETLQEGFQECFGSLTGVVYLDLVLNVFYSASSWNDAEAAIFALDSVSLQARLKGLSELEKLKSEENAVSSPHKPHGPNLRTTRSDGKTVHQMLDSFFSYICALDVDKLMIHECFATTVSRTVEAFSIYLNRSHSMSLTLEAVRCVLGLAGRPGNQRRAACEAFSSLCRRGTKRLGTPTIVATVMQLMADTDAPCFLKDSEIHQAGSHPLSLEEEIFLIQGLSYLIPELSQKDAEAAVLRLTGGLMQRLQYLNYSVSLYPQSSAVSMETLCADMRHCLQLLAASFRAFLPAALSQECNQQAIAWNAESKDVPPFPAKIMLAHSASILGEIAASRAWQQDPEVMESVARVYKDAILSSRKQSLQLLPMIIPAVGVAFQASGCAVCLEVLVETLEVHFKDSNVVLRLIDASSSALEVSLANIANGTISLQGEDSLAVGLLNLAESFALYASSALDHPSLFQGFLDLTIEALKCRETGMVVQALSYLSLILAFKKEGPPLHNFPDNANRTVNSIFSSRIVPLVSSLASSLVDTCPVDHLRTVAECLCRFMVHPDVGSKVKKWTVGVLEKGLSALPIEIANATRQLLLSDGLKPENRTAMLLDLGLVMRHIERPAILLKYASDNP